METETPVRSRTGTPRGALRLVLHQARFDLLAFFRNRQSRFFTLILPIIFLVIFVSVFGNNTVGPGKVKGSTYYVPGICALAVISGSFVNLAVAQATARWPRGRRCSPPRSSARRPRARRAATDSDQDFTQTTTVAVLALRVLLAPCFVVFASLVARRFGVRIGGVVAGLPVIAGPILLVLALQHGSAFASKAAAGVLLGMVGLAAFVLAYVATSKWLSWPRAVVVAYMAFALAVVALRPLSVGALPALIIACGSLVLTLLLLPRPPRVDAAPLAPARWDLPFRAACTAIAVVTVTAIATTLGPHLSGLVTSFPIITAVLAVFTQAHRGRDEAIRLLRGFTVGFFSYAAFCLVVATTIRPLGVTGCFALAASIALCVQAAAVAASQRAQRLPLLSADATPPG